MLRHLSAALLSLTLFFAQDVSSRALPPAGAVSVSYEFPNNTWLENIAMRANGDILTTLVTAPELYLLPETDKHTTASLVHTFPGVTSLTGITELCADEFAVLAGNYSFDTATGIPGTYSAWHVSINGKGKNSRATVRKITDIPLSLANGATTLNAATGLVLMTDSFVGQIWSLNVYTGEHRVVMDHPSMKIAKNADVQFGSNGIRVRVEGGKTFVYYVNTTKDILVRVPVNPKTGEAVGKYETTPLPTGMTADDFAIAADGVVYILGDSTNQIVRVAGGQAQKILGGPKNAILKGPTSGVFGRLPGDENVLFVSTNGGLISSGTPHGGDIVRVQVDKL